MIEQNQENQEEIISANNPVTEEVTVDVQDKEETIVENTETPVEHLKSLTPEVDSIEETEPISEEPVAEEIEIVETPQQEEPVAEVVNPEPETEKIEEPLEEAEPVEEQSLVEDTVEETPQMDAIDPAAEMVEESQEPVAETEAKPRKPEAAQPLVHDPDNFDWSMDKEGFSTYSSSDIDELKKLYEKTLKQIEEQTVVTGTVVAFTEKDIVLDIGFKSDGLVAKTEFRDLSELNIGDEVEVFVETTEDALGQLILSRKKAIAETAWDNIIRAMEKGEIVKGFVKTRTKGGLVVDVWGIDAFLPGSQIDVKPIRDYDIYVGQTMEFKVVKINELFKNVVISHKALIEDDIEAQKGEILSRLEKGQVLEGIVKNMTTFGVFVDLGGVDGLLHITDISWGRINHPEEVLTLDQRINVVVLDFDDEKKRISLGLKQLSPHPWEQISEDLQVGAKVKGKVVTVADYGAFVEIAAGIEGLIHVSEMSWSQHLRNPQDFMKVGDEVETVILSIDKAEHKLSLGIKQLSSDPWEHIEDKYTLNSKHTGIVRNLTNYGLFVELEEGVDGLVHVSDLSWSKKIKHPAEFTKKGEPLEVVVLEIDRENRRLSLGHKQLDENPWETFESIFYEGSSHTGTIIEVNEKGASVALPYGVEGFAPAKHIIKENKSKVHVDEELNFRVIEFNKDTKRIIVSHTDIWKQEERSRRDSEREEETKAAVKTAKAVKDINVNTDRSTMGDLGGLSELKAKMERKESAPAKPKAKAKEVETVVEDKAPVAEEKASEPVAVVEPVAIVEPVAVVETKAKSTKKAAIAETEAIVEVPETKAKLVKAKTAKVEKTPAAKPAKEAKAPAAKKATKKADAQAPEAKAKPKKETKAKK